MGEISVVPQYQAAQDSAQLRRISNSQVPFLKIEQDFPIPKIAFSLFFHVSLPNFCSNPYFDFSSPFLYPPLNGAFMIVEYSTRVWALPPLGPKWNSESILLFLIVKSFTTGRVRNSTTEKIAQLLVPDAKFFAWKASCPKHRPISSVEAGSRQQVLLR